MKKISRLDLKMSPPKLNSLEKTYFSKYLKHKSKNIIEFASKRKFCGILLVASNRPKEMASILLSALLNKSELPINLIFMPDMQTDTLVYDFYSEISKELKINFKILPIKFLQSLYKNTYKEHFGDETIARGAHTLEGIRTTIISSVSKEKDFLFIDSTTMTDFLLQNPPPNISMNHSLCPFHDLLRTDIYELILNSLPEKYTERYLTILDELVDMELEKETDSFISGLVTEKKCFESLKELQYSSACLDKVGHLNNYSSLNYNDYYPVI